MVVIFFHHSPGYFEGIFRMQFRTRRVNKNFKLKSRVPGISP